MSKLLVVFGSTGQTGIHVVRLALEEGLQVRAFARSPDKIPAETSGNESLEIFQGDLTDMGSIHRAIEGADMVVSHAWNPAASKKGPIMLPFVKQVHKSMREHGVKRFLYQAGVISHAPGLPNPVFVRVFMRPVARLMGISEGIRDNDSVIEYLAAEAGDLDWTVTRPGMLKQGPSKGTVRVSEKLSGTIQFWDLAAFSLATVQSDVHIRVPLPELLKGATARFSHRL